MAIKYTLQIGLIHIYCHFPDETPKVNKQKPQGSDQQESDGGSTTAQHTVSDIHIQPFQCTPEPEPPFISRSTSEPRTKRQKTEGLDHQESDGSSITTQQTVSDTPMQSFQCTPEPELPFFSQSTASEPSTPLHKSDSNVPSPSEHHDVHPDICNESDRLCDEDLDSLTEMYPELNATPESESDWHLDPNGLPNRLYDALKFQVLLLALMATSGRWSDGQMQTVLTFISQFLACLVQLDALKTVVTDLFPGTVYRLRKMLGFSSDKLFTRKAVCNKPDCCALYDLQDIYSLDWMFRKTPRTCSACGNPLAKVVYSSTGKRFIMPLKTFCQRDITSQITQMLSRPDIEPLLGKWREDKTSEHQRKDVYSGKVWKRMQNVLGFFKSDYEFGLTLNIDWFRPHKASNKSIGAMYMTVLNLPREIRCKLENILLIGVMPSLDYDDGKVTKTEPQNITPFLTGLKDELLVLWHKGKKITTHLYKSVQMKAALLLIACDSPAARKVSVSKLST